jgi:putative ABC transport system permease protein
MKLVVRTAGPAAGWSTALRAEIEAVAPQALIGAVKPMSDIVAGTRAERRFSLLLLTSFAGVALLLGSIGLHAVLAYSVAQRRREIGIRVVIGAQARDILRLVASQAGRLVLIGIGLGLVGAVGVSRALRGLLYEIQVTDTLSYVVALLVLAAAALLALLVPALRAMKVDPVAALRAE